jgi:hypothetical protein
MDLIFLSLSNGELDNDEKKLSYTQKLRNIFGGIRTRDFQLRIIRCNFIKLLL